MAHAMRFHRHAVSLEFEQVIPVADFFIGFLSAGIPDVQATDVVGRHEDHTGNAETHHDRERGGQVVAVGIVESDQRGFGR